MRDSVDIMDCGTIDMQFVFAFGFELRQEDQLHRQRVVRRKSEWHRFEHRIHLFKEMDRVRFNGRYRRRTLQAERVIQFKAVTGIGLEFQPAVSVLPLLRCLGSRIEFRCAPDSA